MSQWRRLSQKTAILKQKRKFRISLWFFAVFFAIAVVDRLSICFLDSKKMDFLRVHLLQYFKGRPTKPHILIACWISFPDFLGCMIKGQTKEIHNCTTQLWPQQQTKPPNQTPMQNLTMISPFLMRLVDCEW